ncbi:aminoglycoside phosphotransferase family protein [Sphaerisporangium sp. B11E5]|uniref:aminoglycoside phosphotransferase family protein n=1 Tax=Sphaerisporangium sp. B11E5 TaxID=3153563 RepID=UPI00325F3DC7
MTALDGRVLATARRTLGPLTPVPDASLPPHLLLVATADGRRYVLKRHKTPHRFQAEVHAYASWLPHLADHTPTLISADAATLSLLLTHVPGRSATQLPGGSPAEWNAHHAAGRVLRLIHQIPPGPHPKPDVAVYLAERMRWWSVRARNSSLISTAQLRALHIKADVLAATTLDRAVCHLDYQPRNWIVTPNGAVTVVDFEHTRLDARIRDFTRLCCRNWMIEPRLRQAFFNGYGHHPTQEDQVQLGLFALLDAITALVRGHETGDPELLAHGRTVLTRLP